MEHFFLGIVFLFPFSDSTVERWVHWERSFLRTIDGERGFGSLDLFEISFLAHRSRQLNPSRWYSNKPKRLRTGSVLWFRSVSGKGILQRGIGKRVTTSSLIKWLPLRLHPYCLSELLPSCCLWNRATEIRFYDGKKGLKFLLSSPLLLAEVQLSFETILAVRVVGSAS